MDNKITFVPANPGYKNAALERARHQLFMQQLGFTLDELEPGYAVGSMQIEKVHRQHQGFLHGGIGAVICDIVAGFAAYSLVKPGETVVTANLNINYFNPGTGSRLMARGWVSKPGSRLIYCESEILVDNKPGEWLTVTRASAIMCIVEDMTL